MTSLEAPPAAPDQHRDLARTLRPAAIALFGLLVAAQVATVVFSIWEPTFDGTIRYDDIAVLGDAYWPMNVLLGGPSYALGFVAGSIFLVVLGRGSALTLLGAGINLLAGIVFALVITAETLPFAWAASQVGDTEGRALFDLYNANFDSAYLPYVLGSMALVALGALLALIGAARAGGVSWWVPGAAVVIIVATFAVPLGNPLVIVADLAQRALWIYIGWCGLRALPGGA